MNRFVLFPSSRLDDRYQRAAIHTAVLPDNTLLSYCQYAFAVVIARLTGRVIICLYFGSKLLLPIRVG